MGVLCATYTDDDTHVKDDGENKSPRNTEYHTLHISNAYLVSVLLNEKQPTTTSRMIGMSSMTP